LSLDPRCRQPRRLFKHHLGLFTPRTRWMLLASHSPRQASTRSVECGSQLRKLAQPSSSQFMALWRRSTFTTQHHHVPKIMSVTLGPAVAFLVQMCPVGKRSSSLRTTRPPADSFQDGAFGEASPATFGSNSLDAWTMRYDASSRSRHVYRHECETAGMVAWLNQSEWKWAGRFPPTS
jgi:hypothetical protein